MSVEIRTGRAAALGRRGDPREVAHATATDRRTAGHGRAARGDSGRPAGGAVRRHAGRGARRACGRARGRPARGWRATSARRCLADAQLLVAELVANSVRHADAAADAAISVRGHLRADVLCLEVGDRGTSGSISRRAPDLERGGGFGLNLVETLSWRWGVHRDAGTHVWAELAFPAAG